MKTKALTAVMILMVLLLLPGVSHALTNKQQILVGLKGVHVLVENMQPEAERLGLTRAQIKTDVELRLRKAGVRVLTEKESLEIPGMPCLYVNVNAAVGQSLVGYSIQVELKEVVTLARGFKTSGVIWDEGGAGTIGTERIGKLRDNVVEYVDRFINDYLAANPKR